MKFFLDAPRKQNELGIDPRTKNHIRKWKVTELRANSWAVFLGKISSLLVEIGDF